MYPIGFLFGLGFDTATEVALFGDLGGRGSERAIAGNDGDIPLVIYCRDDVRDTTDGILMVGAYGWAFIKPIRKLYYNLTITFVSVIVALIVGGIEAVGLLKDQLKLGGGAWDIIGSLNDNFGTLGFLIIGVFILSWVGSVISIELMDSIGLNRLPRFPISGPLAFCHFNRFAAVARPRAFLRPGFRRSAFS